MQLVILHHHLNRGGVTSVVENQLRALALQPEPPSGVFLLHGGRASAWQESLSEELPFDCHTVVVPELEYDNERTNSGDLLAELQQVLASLDQKQTVLHVHNHSLGKNAQLAPVLGQLAESGWRMLLQIHDFAEDLRPGNYQHLVENSESLEALQRQLYPQAQQIHYAVLNRRDFNVLSQAGLSSDHLHLLPNPVEAPHEGPEEENIRRWKLELCEDLGIPAGNRIVLYPVRAIRRKNLGEVLLWASLVENTSFLVTLAPKNPLEQGNYQRWVQLAAELDLPVVFNSASKSELPFSQVYASADAILTTSVAEGFGMVYLEAALAGKPLVGRLLPSVCDDFLQAGMKFPGLAESLLVPSDCIDLHEYERALHSQIEKLRSAYGMSQNGAGATLEDFGLAGDTIDFGRLESTQQQALIKQVLAEASLRQRLQALNPVLQCLEQLTSPQMKMALKHNCEVIAEQYSPQIIGNQLASLYEKVLSSEPSTVSRSSAVARTILDSFVHPSQLFPLRLEA